MCKKCEGIALSARGIKVPGLDCKQCGTDISQMGIKEWYMVEDAVWKPAAKGDDVLCIGCLEKRLGRMLRPEDFEGYRINYIQGDNEMSPRLQSRIHGCH